MDFDIKAHRWFQQLQRSYGAKRVQVDLVQGSDIVRELIFRHTLRSHYFPDALLLDEVRKLIPRSKALTEKELEPIPGEDTQQYIERLRAKDPRFLYEVTIGGDRGAAVFPPPPEPGLVAAITDGRKTVKAYARDGRALSLDPVGFSITLAGTAIEKMDSLIRTGQPQHFDREEIHNFKATVPLLSTLGLVPGEFDLSIGSVSTSEPIPLRLSFVGDKERVVYELLDFQIVRAGTEEFEISTRNENLPFEIRLALPTPTKPTTKGRITFKKQFVGKDVLQVQKAVAVLRILETGSDIEIYSLRHGKALGVLRVPPYRFDVPQQGIHLIAMLACISEKLGVTIKLPEPRGISQQDFESVSYLYALVTGGTLPLDNVSMTLVKSAENSELLPNILREIVPLRIVHQSITFRLFGTEIHLGTCATQLDKAEFKDPDRILLDFERARIGEGIPLSIRPLMPARIFLLAGQGALPSNT